MSTLLKGKAAADAIDEQTRARVAALRAAGICPTLGILRAGDRDDDIAYERAAVKRAEALGIEVKTARLGEDADTGEALSVIRKWNADGSVHGILVMRPLPKGLSEAEICEAIAPQKDVDGVTRASMAAVYAGLDGGFAPCTAEACLAVLDHYGIELSGRRAAVVGRSLVIGRPVAALLTRRDATVTLCHSRTERLPETIRDADIVVAALGKAEFLRRDCFTAGQTVLDVGIHYSQEAQKLVGDVAFSEVSPLVRAISPVPGGVGSVTTAILCRHVVLAAEQLRETY